MKNFNVRRVYNQLMLLVKIDESKTFVFDKDMATDVLRGLELKERNEVLHMFEKKVRELQTMLNKGTPKTVAEFEKIEIETKKLLTASIFARDIIERLNNRESFSSKKTKKR